MLFYFALSFLFAFFVSQLLYLSFTQGLFTSNTRAKESIDFFPYTIKFLNEYAFVDKLLLLCILLTVLFIYIIKIDGLVIIKQALRDNLMPILIVFGATITSVFSDVLSPVKELRYGASSYPLIIIVLPLFIFVLSKHKKISIFLMLVISIFYMKNTFSSDRIYYMDMNKQSKDIIIFKQKTELPVYGLENLLSILQIHYLNSRQNYVLIKDFDSFTNRIKDDNPNAFYTILIGDKPSVKNGIKSLGYNVVNSSTVNGGQYEIVEFKRDE